jgi:hypothetical protein
VRKEQTNIADQLLGKGAINSNGVITPLNLGVDLMKKLL